jgi:hypothetical protein
MKKSKLLILGLIALMLAGGLVLASCSNCPGGNTMSGTSKGCSGGSYKECENKCITKQHADRIVKTKDSNAKRTDLSCNC